VQNTSPAIRQIGRLCARLEADSSLRNLLEEADLSVDFWARITEAVRQGEINELTSLLEELEDGAAAAGLDGITVETRAYKGFPPVPSVTVPGWRCPHPRPCGRAEVGAGRGTERRCELTGDLVKWVRVTSV
jgi:hypothetical protein